MEYRILGKTGLKISRLGFGGIPIQRIDAEGTKKLMHQMAEAGVNFIDTARGYTVSEEYLGYALEGIRDRFIIATKSMARDKAGMAADIETSLKNLKTDYIDLYQIHNLPPEQLEAVMAPDGALTALMEAKAAGKIGHIGLTSHSMVTFEKALELPWVETFMFPYNIVETQAEELIKKCAEKNIGFIDMKPLAGGAIENATLALRFLAKSDPVDLLIPGMADPKELEENIAAVENPAPLSAAELREMDEIRQTLGTQFCRRCGYCGPCSVGINIPMVFLMNGYYSRYGLQEWAKERWATMAVKPDACMDCGACEPRCPYNLPIRELLKKAAKNFE